jgi:hypothetical protein
MTESIEMRLGENIIPIVFVQCAARWAESTTRIVFARNAGRWDKETKTELKIAPRAARQLMLSFLIAKNYSPSLNLQE